MKLGHLIGGVFTVVIGVIATVAVLGVLLIGKGCQKVEDAGGVKNAVIEVGKDVREIAEEIADTTDAE